MEIHFQDWCVFSRGCLLLCEIRPTALYPGLT